MRAPSALSLLSAPPGAVAVLHDGRTVFRIVLAPSPEEAVRRLPPLPLVRCPEPLRPLQDYLKGRLRRLHIPYALEDVTAFQRQVLLAVRRIPYGRTAGYADLARRIGRPAACRAVGQALKANPLPLLIPCHRVVRSDGSTGGFMGMSDDSTGWKAFLLDLERQGFP